MTVTGEGGHIPPSEQLRSNALGLWQLVIMGIAYMGLALTAYFNFGIMEGITGPIVPLAFAAVTVAMLPTAVSYAIMNAGGRRRAAPSRGCGRPRRRRSASGSAGCS